MQPYWVWTRVRSVRVIGMSFGMHSRGNRGEAADGLRRDTVNQRGARTRRRAQMLHKQLSGDFVRNEKCTGDIDLKRGLLNFRGNRRNRQRRKTGNAALRHRVKSQWGARLRLQLHLCTVHLKSKTRMTTVVTTHCRLLFRSGGHNNARCWYCVLKYYTEGSQFKDTTLILQFLLSVLNKMIYLYVFIVVTWLCAALKTFCFSIKELQYKRWCQNAEVQPHCWVYLLSQYQQCW